VGARRLRALWRTQHARVKVAPRGFRRVSEKSRTNTCIRWNRERDGVAEGHPREWLTRDVARRTDNNRELQ
jgi:hypothetical protein